MRSVFFNLEIGQARTGDERMAKCPYCGNGVVLKAETVADAALEVRKEMVGLIRKEVMYSCPHCDAVLGFGRVGLPRLQGVIQGLTR